ncbi:hypothetical protein NHX12_006848 [Muraenolepis orangiensis]|uniref:Transcription cofactor vestigial-like protein 3 n=1 Tax=Muraenolepis orangiensis TaxID=630683 RepID=A0A9Q0ICG4_9TELE|nr:hypothetical protein NHX12_006848 [Muraenolepis orangiensis]
MYHQSFGAHYLPAAAYKAAYYGHRQRKPSAYSKVQESVEQQQLQQSRATGMLPGEQGHHRWASLGPGSRCSGSSGASSAGGGSPADFVMTKDGGGRPAEAEYLSARCVLFTYFQGSIGDVVDEHFSRALSQSGAFSREAKPLLRVTQQQLSPPLPGTLWKEGASLSEGQCSPIVPPNMWSSSAYPSQAGPCLPSSSISVHPDFSCAGSPLPFHPVDGALWPGHTLSQAGLPDSHSSWAYGLNPGQSGVGSGSYPQIHDIYPHHVHSHHAHRFPHAHMLHSFPSHGAAATLDPRFGPLLLPGARQRACGSEGPGSPPPLCEGVKTEMDPGICIPVAAAAILPASWSPASLHGSLDVYDSGLDLEKAKVSAWF